MVQYPHISPAINRLPVSTFANDPYICFRMFRQLFSDLWKFLSNPQQIVDEPQPRPFRTWLAVLAVDIAITAAVIIPLIYLIDEHVLHLRPIPEISKPMTF